MSNSFAAIDFLQHYGISYVTEGTKHTRAGWLQVACPFCIGHQGYHLGFNLESSFWNCWRCGPHRTWDIVLALLNGDVREAKKAIIEFKGRPIARHRRRRPCSSLSLEMPEGGTQPLTKRARRYLEDRKFDPDLLEAVWKIQSTANFGQFKYRIFIPFFIDNRMVTWQTRDIIGLSDKKYLAQRQDKEIISNHDTLYGLDQATGKSCIIVEGVPDVWRLGPGAVSTQGIKYRPAQVKTLIKNFEEVFVLFDPEPQAIKQAQALAADLSALGVSAHILEVEAKTDPGDYEDADAAALMRELKLGGY